LPFPVFTVSQPSFEGSLLETLNRSNQFFSTFSQIIKILKLTHYSTSKTSSSSSLCFLHLITPPPLSLTDITASSTSSLQPIRMDPLLQHFKSSKFAKFKHFHIVVLWKEEISAALCKTTTVLKDDIKLFCRVTLQGVCQF